jgi:hypothetical protein
MMMTIVRKVVTEDTPVWNVVRAAVILTAAYGGSEVVCRIVDWRERRVNRFPIGRLHEAVALEQETA